MTLPAPKHYWNFNETSGTTAADATGSAVMALDRACWVPGRQGNAVRFNPKDGVRLATTNLPEMPAPWTAAFWVYREADSEGAALWSSNTHAIKLEQWGGTHRVGITKFAPDGFDKSFDCAMRQGTWGHLAVVATEAETKVYLDGKLQGTLPTSINLGLSWLGSSQGYVEYASAILDEVKIFDQALTDDQVAELASEGATTRLGPFGTGGTAWDDQAVAASSGPITQIIVDSGAVIDAIDVTYGRQQAPHHGGTGGSPTTITIAADDAITEIRFLTTASNPFNGAGAISQMTIKTAKGHSYGPFGSQTTGEPAALVAPEGSCVLSFFGAVGKAYISALGATVGPVVRNLIQNGSFEQGVAVSGAYTTLSAGSQGISGWTVSRGNIDYAMSDLWDAAEGSRSIDLCGDTSGGLKQTIETIPGQVYSVTFALAGNPMAGPDPKVMRVEVTPSTPAQSAEFQFSIAGRSSQNMGWQRKTWQFTAQATSTTIELYAVSGGSYGPALDDVGVWLGAAPGTDR